MAIYHKGKKIFNQLHEGNIISQIYHMGKKYTKQFLSSTSIAAIRLAFGEEAVQVIRLTNDYLNAIALTDRTNAQQIADWLNVYALEDAHIVYSLVPTLGVMRAWVTNENACIDSGFIPTTNYEKIVFEFYLKQSNAGKNLIGSYSGQRVGFTIYSGSSTNNSFYWETAQTYNSTRYTFIQGEKYLVEMTANNGMREVKVNGETIIDGAYSGTVANCFSHTYFAAHNQQGIVPNNKGGICHIAEWSAEGVQRSEMYPFIRNGVNGMIDLITGTFRQSAAGSGTPTIEETPATPIQLTDK